MIKSTVYKGIKAFLIILFFIILMPLYCLSKVIEIFENKSEKEKWRENRL